MLRRKNGSISLHTQHHRTCSHDLKASWLIGFSISKGISTLGLMQYNDKKLQWTGPKVSLIELIYSLQTAGVIINGAADIKHLTDFFERAFQIDLGNVYNVFQEMRIRKKTEAVFWIC